MIDSIGSTPSVGRAQPLAQTNSLRSPDVLTAVQQKSQRSSSSTAPVKIFAVPQTTKGGASSNAKVPRGSLVDVLA